MTIKRLFIFLEVLAAIPTRILRTFSSDVPKRIAVIQLAQLGDMICTTPMFRAIKVKYPDCEMYVVGNAVNRHVLHGNPDIDEYIQFSGDMGKTARELKSKNIDVGFTTMPGFVGLAILFLAGAKRMVVPTVAGGLCPSQTISYKLLALFSDRVQYRLGQYAPRFYLKLLERIGIKNGDTTKHLYFSSQAGDKIDRLIRDAGVSAEDFVIGISPSSGNKVKNWESGKFAELARRLAEKHKAKIIVIGGPGDTEEVSGMFSHLGGLAGIIDTSGKLSIDELKALISRLDLFVSVDTGPIYIAEAFNIPTVDITGPIDEREQPPIGEYHKVVVPPNRVRPELYVMNARIYDYKEARRQVGSISVDMVERAVSDLVNKIRINVT